MFQFLSKVTHFLDSFVNYHKFKVVRQHTEGMLGSITRVLLDIWFCFQQWKNF